MPMAELTLVRMGEISKSRDFQTTDIMQPKRITRRQNELH